ncbi:hypothetical protein CVT24_011274, partial [Panaeolus cyanescens]
SLLVFIFSVAFVAISFFPGTRALSVKTLRTQALAILFGVVVIIAAAIPYTIFFAKRGPKVTAYLGGTKLPDSVVAPLVAARVGSRAFYRNIDYLRLLAIFPWVAIFFGLISAVVLFKAASSTTTEPSKGPETAEKSSVSLHEKA